LLVPFCAARPLVTAPCRRTLVQLVLDKVSERRFLLSSRLGGWGLGARAQPPPPNPHPSQLSGSSQHLAAEISKSAIAYQRRPKMQHRYVWFYNRVSAIVVLITLIVA